MFRLGYRKRINVTVDYNGVCTKGKSPAYFSFREFCYSVKFVKMECSLRLEINQLIQFSAHNPGQVYANSTFINFLLNSLKIHIGIQSLTFQLDRLLVTFFSVCNSCSKFLYDIRVGPCSLVECSIMGIVQKIVQ